MWQLYEGRHEIKGLVAQESMNLAWMTPKHVNDSYSNVMSDVAYILHTRFRLGLSTGGRLESPLVNDLAGVDADGDGGTQSGQLEHLSLILEIKNTLPEFKVGEEVGDS